MKYSSSHPVSDLLIRNQRLGFLNNFGNWLKPQNRNTTAQIRTPGLLRSCIWLVRKLLMFQLIFLSPFFKMMIGLDAQLELNNESMPCDFFPCNFFCLEIHKKKLDIFFLYFCSDFLLMFWLFLHFNSEFFSKIYFNHNICILSCLQLWHSTVIPFSSEEYVLFISIEWLALYKPGSFVPLCLYLCR